MEKLEYEKIEELLIKSVWSDQAARSYLLENINNDEIFRILIQVVETSESGDTRMEAAFFLSKCSEKLLESAEKELLTLMDDEWDSVAVHIMVALSRIKSKEALKKIITNRIKPALPWEARCLEIYFQGETDGTV